MLSDGLPDRESIDFKLLCLAHLLLLFAIVGLQITHEPDIIIIIIIITVHLPSDRRAV